MPEELVFDSKLGMLVRKEDAEAYMKMVSENQRRSLEELDVPQIQEKDVSVRTKWTPDYRELWARRIARKPVDHD